MSNSSYFIALKLETKRKLRAEKARLGSLLGTLLLVGRGEQTLHHSGLSQHGCAGSSSEFPKGFPLGVVAEIPTSKFSIYRSCRGRTSRILEEEPCCLDFSFSFTAGTERSEKCIWDKSGSEWISNFLLLFKLCCFLPQRLSTTVESCNLSEKDDQTILL